jgi:type III secretory pathway component EscT
MSAGPAAAIALGIAPDTLSATVALGILLAMRVLPLAWLLPAAGPRGMPWFFVSALGIALGVTLLPVALAASHATLQLDATLLPQVATELVRGAVFGLAVTLPLHAFGWAGELSDLARAAPAQPLAEQADAGPSVAVLYRYGVLAVFFASGSHLRVIGSFADGLRRFPLGSAQNSLSVSALLVSTTELVSSALQLALELAAPVLLCMLLLVVLAGILSRMSSPLVLPLAQGPLMPMLGLAVVCLGVSLILPQAPTAIHVFVLEAERILRLLG